MTIDHIVNLINDSGAAILAFHMTPRGTAVVVDWRRDGVYEVIHLNAPNAFNLVCLRIRELLAS